MKHCGLSSTGRSGNRPWGWRKCCPPTNGRCSGRLGAGNAISEEGGDVGSGGCGAGSQVDTGVHNTRRGRWEGSSRLLSALFNWKCLFSNKITCFSGPQ